MDRSAVPSFSTTGAAPSRAAETTRNVASARTLVSESMVRDRASARVGAMRSFGSVEMITSLFHTVGFKF